MRPRDYFEVGLIVGQVVRQLVTGPETAKIRQSIRGRVVSLRRRYEAIVEYEDWLDTLPTTPKGGE